MTFPAEKAIIQFDCDLQEVTEINKQKFLAELGKLLTFMYEEDRQTALAMYSKMFDDAESEQELMQLLVSPTRQAVVVARSYNAKERKLQVESQSRGENDRPEETPAFVLAIDKLYDRIAVKQPEQNTGAMTDQFSLFEDDKHPIDDDEYVPFPLQSGAPVESAEVDEEELQIVEAVPQEEEVPAAYEEETPAYEEELPVYEEVPAVYEEAPPAEEAYGEPEAEAPYAAPEVEEPAPILEDGFVEPEPTEHPEPDPPAPAGEEQPAARFVEPDEPEIAEQMSFVEVLSAPDAPARKPLQAEGVQQTVRKPKVFLLILYILVAVPVGLIGLALLLIPTLLCLGLALAVIAAGAATLVAAFGMDPVTGELVEDRIDQRIDYSGNIKQKQADRVYPK